MDVTADGVRGLAEAAAAYDEAYEAAFGHRRNFGVKAVVVQDPDAFDAAAAAVGAHVEDDGATSLFRAFGYSFMSYVRGSL